MAFFGQKYGLTPLQKCDILEFEKFCFLSSKRFFSAKSESIVSRLILIKFKLKNWHVLTKNMG